MKSFLSLPQSFSGLCFSFQRLKILEVYTFKTNVLKSSCFFPLDCFFAEDNTVYLTVAREIIVLFLQFTSDFWNISMTINLSIFSQHILRAIAQCMLAVHVVQWAEHLSCFVSIVANLANFHFSTPQFPVHFQASASSFVFFKPWITSFGKCAFPIG